MIQKDDKKRIWQYISINNRTKKRRYNVSTWQYSSYVAAMLGSRNKLNLPTVPDAHGLAALSIDLNMSGLANSLNPIWPALTSYPVVVTNGKEECGISVKFQYFARGPFSGFQKGTRLILPPLYAVVQIWAVTTEGRMNRRRVVGRDIFLSLNIYSSCFYTPLSLCVLNIYFRFGLFMVGDIFLFLVSVNKLADNVELFLFSFFPSTTKKLPIYTIGSRDIGYDSQCRTLRDCDRSAWTI